MQGLEFGLDLVDFVGDLLLLGKFQFFQILIQFFFNSL